MTRLPSIDGLRGIAALMVVVFHGFASAFESSGWDRWWFFRPGFLGVRLFFVLSGALISGLLWSMLEEHRTLGATWPRFAVRRAVRILPLAYLAMLIAWVAGLPAMRNAPWWHLTFTLNIGHGLRETWPIGLGHFWTLAVEEQLYAVWPVALLLVPIAFWPRVAVGLLIVTTVGRGIAWHVGMKETWTFLFLDAFAAGSLVAWGQRQHDDAMTARLAVCGVMALAVSAWADVEANWSVQETGMVLCLAALVGWAWSHPTQRALAFPPLVWLGTISYGIYVWHELVPSVLWHLGYIRGGYGWPMFALKLGAGVGLAALSWYAFERPINRLKDRTLWVTSRVTQSSTA